MTEPTIEASWKHPDLQGPKPPGYVHHESLREEARRLLNSGNPCDPATARGGQIRSRNSGDVEALALWSKLRVRALRHVGDLSLMDWR